MFLIGEVKVVHFVLEGVQDLSMSGHVSGQNQCDMCKKSVTWLMLCLFADVRASATGQLSVDLIGCVCVLRFVRKVTLPSLPVNAS